MVREENILVTKVSDLSEEDDVSEMVRGFQHYDFLPRFDDFRLPGFMLVTMEKEHLPMAKWAFTLLNIPQSGKICDIGCGGGYNLHSFPNQNAYGKRGIRRNFCERKRDFVLRKRKRKMIRKRFVLSILCILCKANRFYLFRFLSIN